ncbi:NHLP family bacteriocin export ABC transporter peptidase/permease/ATPase subunit [Halorhodospira abdelmalekii]|nr:NHLP family bacteriocin export ABC transporter peptidase/permease/ATPase subunit [Halorhodospira abdelmalekii]
MQMEAVECGAAALAMILAYYGRHVPLEELRIQCGVSRDGSKASNVIRAARKWGLEARGTRRELEEIGEISLPAIVFWNFNHFVVLEGFSRRGVHINDPAMGSRLVTYEEFDEAFTGVVLEFKPGVDFQPGGERPSTLTAILKRSSGMAPGAIFLILVGLAFVVPNLLVPIFTKVFVDEILVGQLDSWLMPLLVGMVVAAVSLILLSWLESTALLRLQSKLSITSSSRFFWHVIRLPLSFYQQRTPGEISDRVALNEDVAETLVMDVATTVIALMKIGFFLALMFFFDWLLTLIAVGVAVLNVVILRLVARLRSDRSQRLLIDRGKLAGTSQSGLRGIETIKASGSESDFFAKWAGYHARTVNAEQSLARLTIPLGIVPALLNGINTALILGIGGMQVMEGALTIGALVAFQALVAQFVEPVNELVDIGSNVQEMTGSMRRLDDVMRHPTQIQPESVPLLTEEQPTRLEGRLTIRDLTYGFSPLDPPLVDGFSLDLLPGQRVALVGPSGCGKSTIARMVVGLYQPWSGEILFDGKPRGYWHRDVLLSSIAMVDQDVMLFAGTVRENLTMWDASIPEERLLQAGKDAAIHPIIASRSGGYEGYVNEGGGNFSGGQRQRLEIARALISMPSLLIMDEATSALDPESELIVDRNIRRRGCSCLIVAHRLSTIRDCDQIIVLDGGKVVERGAHDELMSANGAYRALVETM